MRETSTLQLGATTMHRNGLLFAALLVLLTACTDAERGKWGALGSKATVTCYSGGHAFYVGRSTGKVAPEAGGAGYFLRDSARAKLVEVSGQCLVEYDEQ